MLHLLNLPSLPNQLSQLSQLSQLKRHVVLMSLGAFRIRALVVFQMLVTPVKKHTQTVLVGIVCRAVVTVILLTLLFCLGELLLLALGSVALQGLLLVLSLAQLVVQ